MKKQKNLMTMSELAELLGVDRRQVWAWNTRSARNGFPQPIRTIMRLGHTVHVWDADSVLAWHQRYVPSVGGRPKGSRSSKKPVDTVA